MATSLVNRAMPLVRYRTGDRGAWRAGRCECGLAFPLLEVVTGRELDHVELPGGRRLSPYAFTCALEGVPGLLRYQVVQIEPGRLRVLASVAPGDRREAPATLRAAVLQAAGLELEVEVELVDRFEPGRGGKFRVVRSEMRRGAAGSHRAPAAPLA